MRTTIEIDDALLKDAKKLAVDRGCSLRALVEEGLRRIVQDELSHQMLELTIYGGPPVPEAFPWRSGKAMIEVLEGPDARP